MKRVFSKKLWRWSKKLSTSLLPIAYVIVFVSYENWEICHVMIMMMKGERWTKNTKKKQKRCNGIKWKRKRMKTEIFPRHRKTRCTIYGIQNILLFIIQLVGQLLGWGLRKRICDAGPLTHIWPMKEKESVQYIYSRV